MRWTWWVALVALVAVLGAGPALSRRHAPNLLDDEVTKKVVRAAECTFGGQGRELGSTWFADLGPPFGVMYCIKCECVPVHKKRRIIAKVQCRNIKNECPKPSCDEPVLHPGRCCKTCPGDLYSPDTPQDLPQVMTAEEEEKDARHFATLLTGPQYSPAAIRFVLRRRSLYFSVESGDGAPRFLRVMDPSGSVLEQVPLAGDGALAGRSCGAWRRLPRDYRKLLREGRLTAALLWKGETEPGMTGPIVSHSALSTEMFSALLESDPSVSEGLGWGGTAAISASAGAAPSVHVTVLFTGLLASEHLSDVPVVITLEMIDKNTTILEEIRYIKKPSNMNVVELSSPVSATDLRLLARGRLRLALRAARPGVTIGAQPVLRGPALSKLACDVFHAPLAATPRSSLSLASGVACLHLNREGDLVYAIQIDELNMLESPMITLIDEANKRHTELEDLAPLRDGLSNGSLDRMGPRLLESLYSGDIVVNVATHSDGSVIRGRLTSRPVADAQDLNGPTLIKRPDLTQPADLVGLAWISVDYECSIQWEVTIAGPASSGLPLSGLELWMDMRPMLAPGAPVISRQLGTLESPEGALLTTALIDLHRLHSGACELIVKEPVSNTTLLRGMLKQIKVPESCLSRFVDNAMADFLDVPSRHPNSADNSLGDTASCFHSDSFYDDGTQWTSANEPCTMCSCLHGRVRCDAFRCPPLTCGAKAMIRPGECCPTCSNSSLQDANTSSTRGCHQAGQFHPAGQSWHPYLPPAGFDTCAICTCEARMLKVQCTRVSCPPLACPEKMSFRPDRKACCRICSEQVPEVVDRTGFELRDEGAQWSSEDVLAAGGCRYPIGGPLPNGHEWHPTVHSHGEQKCVTCRCKDGEVKCDRKRCTRSICNSQLSQARRRGAAGTGAPHKGATKAPPDECCQQHCRRYRRHQRHHRPART